MIKDCWLEDRQDRALEHDTVERVQSAVGQAEFRRRFIDICGHRTTRNAALDRVCEILNHCFDKQGGFYAVPIHGSCRVVETMQPPRPRIRYQIVYRERGDSFYHIRSLQKAYLDLNEITKGRSIYQGISLAQRNLQPYALCIRPSLSTAMSAQEISSVVREERSFQIWNSRGSAMWTS